MKRTAWGLLVLFAAVLMASAAFAQPPEGQGPGRGRRGPGGPGGPGFGGPRNPLVAALDADGDGVISAEEIKNAAAALKKLDKNEDGKLTREELMPAGFRGRGPGGPGGPGAGRGISPEAVVERMLSNDKNEDGKLSKDEVPERMQQAFDRLDTNEDGFLDKKELGAMVERFQQGRRGRGGEEADRPRRRQRPPADDNN